MVGRWHEFGIISEKGFKFSFSLFSRQFSKGFTIHMKIYGWSFGFHLNSLLIFVRLSFGAEESKFKVESSFLHKKKG